MFDNPDWVMYAIGLCTGSLTLLYVLMLAGWV